MKLTMHNHNNTNDGHDHKHMMWMMLICCALPLALLLFGGSALSSGGYFPKILIGAFAVACFLMMWKGHGGHGETHADEKGNTKEVSKANDEHKHGSCCR